MAAREPLLFADVDAEGVALLTGVLLGVAGEMVDAVGVAVLFGDLYEDEPSISGIAKKGSR